MSLESLAEIFGVAPPNALRQIFFSCAWCLSTITASEIDGRVVLVCASGCTEAELIGALTEVEPKFVDWWLNGRLTSDSDEKDGDASARGSIPLQRRDNARAAGLDEAGGSAETQMPRQGERPDEASASNEENDQAFQTNDDSEPHLNGQVEELHPDLQSWKMVLYAMAQTQCDKAIKENRLLESDLAAFDEEAWAVTVGRLRHNPKVWQTNDPEGLNESEIEEELLTVAVALRDHYAPATSNGDGQPLPAALIIKSKQENATIMNAEYLARPEIIEKLGYSQSIALAIGGKHHGKTTNVRTLALSVLRGLPIWGRQTTQGAVIYAASDDELASTRNELLAMGWERGEALTLVHVNPEVDASREQILEDIGKAAIQEKAVLIILDMLFDFVSIGNELSYAETRRAINAVQQLADDTKALVVGTHHTPKYLNDAHNATNAALGSQGISARFSPIILTRKWAETLYTVDSTTVRDPRGEALKPMKIIKNSQGWIETAGEFKEWMKWEIYAARVLELFENGKGLTVYSISEKLGIDRARIQNTCKELESQGKLRREKQSRKYVYYLGSSGMFEREGGNWSERN